MAGQEISNGDDIVAILKEQPATGKFIATKLCRFFVADEPGDKIIADVADAYTVDGDNIRKMLHRLFTA